MFNSHHVLHPICQDRQDTRLPRHNLRTWPHPSILSAKDNKNAFVGHGGSSVDSVPRGPHIDRPSSLLASCDYLIKFCWAWWLIGRVDAYRPKGRVFDSRSSRHVGTLGKSFIRSCLWRIGVKLRHSIRSVSGAPLSSSGLEEVLYK